MSSITAPKGTGRHNPRFFALDAARGVALFGMLVSHTSPFVRPLPKLLDFGVSVLNDVASPLFALTIGVTMVVAGPAVDAPSEQRRRYRNQTVIRALILIGLGLLLELRFSGVVIVLAHLGITMLAAVALIFARARTLLMWAAVSLAVIPGVVTWVRFHPVPSLFDGTIPTPVAKILGWMLFDTGYQALNLLPIVLIGIAIGRTILNERRPMRMLLGGACAVFLTVQVWMTLDLPGHDLRGGYAEVWRETALSLAAFALVMLVASMSSERIMQVAERALEPCAVMGRMALSLYTLHILILMWIYSAVLGDPAIGVLWRGGLYGWSIMAGMLLICWAFAAAWWRWLGTGPVERVMGVILRRHPASSLLRRR